MCRLAVYLGMPIQLADLVTKPKRSILTQSYDARERQPHTVEHLKWANLNGDGFGVGWYHRDVQEDSKPCVFTSVLPAWNNKNLARLAEKVASPLIFAHVRAAYPGMPVSEQNCHPFVVGKYMFMHNGNVGDFLKVRRSLLSSLSEPVYNSCQSFHSDSAVCFAVFLNQLRDFETDYSAIELADKMNETIQIVLDACAAAGCEEHSLLNFVLSDGKTVIATKYSDSGRGASLYMSAGTSFETVNPRSGLEDFHIIRSSYRTKFCLVASEPITATCSAWTKVPENTMLIMSREKDDDVNVSFSPIIVRTGANGAANGAQDSGRRPSSGSGSGSGGGGRERADSGGSLTKLSRASSMARNESFRGLESVLAGMALSSKAAEPMGDRQLIGRVMAEPDDLLTGHRGSVVSMVLDGDVMYSGGVDGTVGVWDMDAFSGKFREFLKLHEGPVMAMAVTEDHLLSIGDNEVRFTDKRTFEVVAERTIRVEQCGPLMTLCAAGGCVAFGGQDCVLRGAWKSAQDEDYAIATKAHNSFINNMVILSDKMICTAGADTMVKVWNLEAMEPRVIFRGHKGPVVTLARSSDGCLLFSGSRDNTVRVWDMEELCCRHTISGHSNDVVKLECVPSRDDFEGAQKDVLCSVSLDQTCRFWDLHSYTCIQLIKLAAVPTSSLVHNGSLYIGNVRGEISEWRLDFLEESEGEEGGFGGGAHVSRLSASEGHRAFFNLQAPKGKGARDSERALLQYLKDFIAIPSISGSKEYVRPHVHFSSLSLSLFLPTSLSMSDVRRPGRMRKKRQMMGGGGVNRRVTNRLTSLADFPCLF